MTRGYTKAFCRVLIAVLVFQWSGLPNLALARSPAQLARAEAGRGALAFPSAAELGQARGAELKLPARVELNRDKLVRQARAAEAAIPKVDYDVMTVTKEMRPSKLSWEG